MDPGKQSTALKNPLVIINHHFSPFSYSTCCFGKPLVDFANLQGRRSSHLTLAIHDARVPQGVQRMLRVLPRPGCHGTRGMGFHLARPMVVSTFKLLRRVGLKNLEGEPLSLMELSSFGPMLNGFCWV